MTSKRQIAANRSNSRKSTGPKTIAGKSRSRSNARRHGLTSETVITVLEDQKEYQRFETKILSDFVPRSVAERALVCRLASLLWRLRRATAIETDLLQIQHQVMQERRLRTWRSPSTFAASAE